MGKLLHALQPAIRLFPEIQQPRTKITNEQKVLYTSITLFIYLVCSQIPLYGVLKSEGSDPFYWMRVILASNRGTLMQLGISPVISAGWILQLLVGTKIISADMHTVEDRKLFEGASKLLSIIIAFGQSFAYVWSGHYGTIEDIGVGNAMLIMFQLTSAGFIVILLDDLLQKGYGLGSGISLFIAVNACEVIVWKTLSPITYKSEYGIEFQGSLVALIHFLLTKQSKASAFYQALYRHSGPNLSNLLATILTFFIVIYMQGFRLELKLSHKQARGYERRYPIKLFYTSNISMIFQSALVSNLYFLSERMYRRFKGTWWIGIFGTWQDIDGSSIPVGGFSYWISPPKDFTHLIMEPLHSLFFLLFVMSTCAFFSRFWLEVSKESPRDVEKNLKEGGWSVTGHQGSSTLSVLNKHIPIAAALGGMIIGLISVFSDLAGAIGSGTGILLAVSIIYGYYEQLAKNKKGVEKEEVY